MPSILSVGNDAILTKSRAAVLATALQASVLVTDPPAAMLILRDQQFDLVVLCHTVSPEQAQFLLQAARNQTPPARTLIVDPLFSGALTITRNGERTGPSADPAVLVAEAKKLLAQQMERHITPDHTGLHLAAREQHKTPAI